MFQRRGSMIIKPIWRSNNYRSLSSSMISRRALLQRLYTTQFSSTKICSHHVHTFSLCNNDHYNTTQYRQLSPLYINCNTDLSVILTYALFPYHSPCFLFFVNESIESDIPQRCRMISSLALILSSNSSLALII
jgi:hypothetical protein